MQTNALISLIQREAKDMPSELIREIINEIQKMTYRQRPVKDMQMYDSSTGLDPRFTATSGTYEYTINTTNGFDNNADFVTTVYVTDIDSPTDVLTFPANASSAAKIVFRANPGSSKFYIRAFKQPTEVSTTRTALTIPDAYHLSHVYEGVMGFIEQQKSGRSDRWEKWMNVLMPDLVAKLASSNRGEGGNIPIKGY